MWSLLLPLALAADPAPAPPIAVDRWWDLLSPPGEDLRGAYRRAGEALGTWRIEVAGAPLDGPTLIALAATAPDEPFTRVVREGLKRPFDPLDLLFLIDDVLVAGKAGRRGEAFVVTHGRARSSGVLLHPDDVFFEKERKYPNTRTLQVDDPPAQTTFVAPPDGALPGPEWTMRYRSPTDEAEMFRTLAEKRPGSDFSARVAELVAQLRRQGVEVWPTSFLRYRERGYLMWGAYELRRAKTELEVQAALKKLAEANEEWAHVPILWAHPDGWEATREAGRRMADAFEVAYATKWGAEHSHHYDGTAVDFAAVSLPRTLELTAPNGVHATFDLSGADQSRDLSLTPELVDWIDENFHIVKLKDDHPHWDDDLERDD